MRPGSANIRSPEAIGKFRRRFLEFDKRAHQALDLAKGDLRSVEAWLRREQLPYWRRQLRRRHDKMKEAWRAYVNARHGDRRLGKPSYVDERKAFERAKRRRREAEAKLERVERWLAALEHEAEQLLPPCKRFEVLLDELAPKAVARLNYMMDRLEEYLLPASPGPSGGRGRGREKGSDAAK